MQERRQIIAGTSYLIAEGPEGLKGLLEAILKAPSTESHHILYKNGSQESLIMADIQEASCKFYYNDRLGRPAPSQVFEVIKKCMENQGGNSYQFNDMHYVRRAKKVEDSISGVSDAHPNTLDFTHNQLNFAIQTNAWNKLSKIGIFSHGPVVTTNPGASLDKNPGYRPPR